MLRQLSSFFLVCTLALTSRAQDNQASADLTTAILTGYAEGSLTTSGGSVMFSGDPIGSDGLLDLENSVALEDWFAMMDTLTSYDGDTTVFIGTLGDGAWLEEMIDLSGTDGWVYLEPTEYTTITLIPSERLAYAPSSEPTASAGPATLPADNNPADGVVSEEEFDTYCQAWRSGVNWPEHGGPIPIDFVTRTAWIFWEFDGYYQSDPEGDPDNPTTYQGSTSVTTTGVIVTIIGGGSWPITKVYWRAARIYCSLTAPEDTYACAVEMPIPTGWHRLPVDKYVDSDTQNGLDLMSNGTVDPDGRMVRWGPYQTWTLPMTIGFGVLSMEGEIVPEATDLSATVSYDGVSSPLPNLQTADPWLQVIFGWDSAASDPVLHLAGPLLERALAGRANRPKKDFAPVFERFTDEQGQPRMRCTLVRDVIFPEMGFTVQRTTNFTDWVDIDTEWTLLKQSGRDLTFTTTFACLSNGKPETYRVVVEEHSTAASALQRELASAPYALGSLIETFDPNFDVELDEQGNPLPPAQTSAVSLFSFDDGGMFWQLSNTTYITRLNGTLALDSLADGYALLFANDLAEEALQLAELYGLESHTLPQGETVLLNPGQLDQIDSRLRQLIASAL